MIPLALSCAAALALGGLPDDAPTAAEPPASPSPSPTLTPPAAAPAVRPLPRPSRMPYLGGPVPTDYELVLEHDASLLLGGMSSLIFGYTGGIIFGLIAGLHSLVEIQRADPLFALVPLVGPLLALGGPGYRSQVNPDLLYLRDVVCIGDAVVQWLGAILAGIGYFFPTKVLVLKEGGGSGVGVVVPLGPGGGPGLSWSMAFGP